MELLKRNIHMNRQKSKAVSQLTLDDDYNVPDTKMDVSRIIQSKGMIKIDNVQVSQDQILVSGSLEIKVLYISDSESKSVHSLEGSIPFEENINLDGVVNGDNIRLKWDIEDLSTTLINSRKLSMKAIVTFRVSVEEIFDTETAVDVQADEDVSRKNKKIEVLEMCMNKKDTYRIKDEITLPSNKPNIQEILWDNLQLRGVELRLEEDKVAISGELFLFVLYSGEDENNTLQWVENALPFEGTIDCPGCREDMISNIEVDIMNSLLEVRPDYDGEERVIQLDVVLELDMRFYEETSMEMLMDLYLPSKEIQPIYEDETYESLLVKNSSKCKTSERIAIDNKQDKMLQICHSDGEVQIDEVTVVEKGLQIEGVLKLQVLYITADDTMPFYTLQESIPFEHTVEVPDINDQIQYYLKASLEQLSTTMADSEEIEVKAVINLDVLVIRRQTEKRIADVEVKDLDMKKMQEMPGIVGYVVQPADTVWDIAKQFYTSIDDICRINEVEEGQIKAGDRLIIMKKMDDLTVS